MPYVHLGYGKANLTNTLATYAALKVTPPFNRVTAVNSGKRIGMNVVTPVGRHELNGALISQQVEHPFGTVILLQVKWMRSASILREGSIFLRLREGAAMYTVLGRVPTSHDNICGDTFQLFLGHADIMTREDLQMVGLEVNRSYANRFMDIEELDECFVINQMTKETIGRPGVVEVVTPTGAALREVAQAPQRRLIIRRRS